MTFSKKSNAKSQSQLEKFKEAARQIETDDDDERFNEKLRKLAKQKQSEKSADE